MNYQKHYDTLIARGQRTLIHGYREKHHIIPKCMGGTNDKTNIVRLTPEEHFIAHKLLTKIYPSNPKLLFGVIALCMGNDKVKRNNKLTGFYRRKYSESLTNKKRVFSEQGLANIKEYASKPKSEQTKQLLREINLNRGPCSEETRKKLSKAGIGKTKSFKGRIAHNKDIPMTQEQKDKISETKRLNPPKRVCCLFCHKESTATVISAWHKNCSYNGML